MRLAASSVTVQYPGAAVPALDEVSFGVSGGELVAVVGPNGSGKTTLLRTLLGLTRPQSGVVRLDDRDIGTWTRRALAGVIGALPQREEPAFPLTVREVVLMGRWARLGPTAAITADDEAAIAGALARCDVTGFEDRGIETLSGGEWQRVRVARALTAMPRLLLLDEPTAALDIGHEMALFALLRQLVGDGLGVLVITHHLNLAARYADRLVLLDRGRVVADGPPNAVLRANLVSAVFEWPVAVVPWSDGTSQVVPLKRNEERPAP